jgi:hypothetical protein
MQSFGEETRGKETTWKLKRKWEANSKMDFQEVDWGLEQDQSGS